MADKQILCAFGIDLDAVGGWLGSYGGEDSPDDISRGLFAGEVGTLRLLKLFDNLGVQTTWFIPDNATTPACIHRDSTKMNALSPPSLRFSFEWASHRSTY